jgi:hypothetical protein
MLKRWEHPRAQTRYLALDFSMSDSASEKLWRAFSANVKAMRGARLFMSMSMQRVQRRVKHDLEAQGKSTDCSGCSAFDVGPMRLNVTSLSPEGVFTTDAPHCFDQANPDRRECPIPVTFANVPSELAAAGVVEGATV